MALVYLLANPDINLVGIVSPGENIEVEQMCANNLGLVKLFRATAIPVCKGNDKPLCDQVA
ncbi:nucleoside hydrolase [Mycobacterium leprae]|uniref:nucleoside hydrolase n=1 Tax=Mycobacterium leprae TaxID=1769 RepID=UPI000B17AE7C|nr:nucleoside hydrolase [Mycobacterium leprae]